MKKRMSVISSFINSSFVFLFFSTSGFSQFNETIRTGRPGQAIGPFGVGKNVYQIQSGVDFGGMKFENISGSDDFTAFNTFFRAGITRNFELNTKWEYKWQDNSLGETDQSLEGVSVSTVGTRINFLDEKDIVPALGMQFSLHVPFKSGDYFSKGTNPEFMFIAGKSFDSGWNVFLNKGLLFISDGDDIIGKYVLNFNYSISSSWQTFIEAYGSYNRFYFDKYIDTGLAYLYSDNLQLDIYGGGGINKDRTDYFISLGISWRVVARANTSTE